MRTKVHHHHHYHFGMVVTNLKKDHVEYLQDIPDLQNHRIDKSIIKSITSSTSKVAPLVTRSPWKQDAFHP